MDTYILKHVPKRRCPFCDEWHAVEAVEQEREDRTPCPHYGWKPGGGREGDYVD